MFPEDEKILEGRCKLDLNKKIKEEDKGEHMKQCCKTRKERTGGTAESETQRNAIKSENNKNKLASNPKPLGQSDNPISVLYRNNDFNADKHLSMKKEQNHFNATTQELVYVQAISQEQATSSKWILYKAKENSVLNNIIFSSATINESAYKISENITNSSEPCKTTPLGKEECITAGKNNPLPPTTEVSEGAAARSQAFVDRISTAANKLPNFQSLSQTCNRLTAQNQEHTRNTAITIPKINSGSFRRIQDFRLRSTNAFFNNAMQSANQYQYFSPFNCMSDAMNSVITRQLIKPLSLSEMQASAENVQLNTSWHNIIPIANTRTGRDYGNGMRNIFSTVATPANNAASFSEIQANRFALLNQFSSITDLMRSRNNASVRSASTVHPELKTVEISMSKLSCLSIDSCSKTQNKLVENTVTDVHSVDRNEGNMQSHSFSCSSKCTTTYVDKAVTQLSPADAEIWSTVPADGINAINKTMSNKNMNDQIGNSAAASENIVENQTANVVENPPHFHDIKISYGFRQPLKAVVHQHGLDQPAVTSANNIHQAKSCTVEGVKLCDSSSIDIVDNDGNEKVIASEAHVNEQHIRNHPSHETNTSITTEACNNEQINININLPHPSMTQSPACHNCTANNNKKIASLQLTIEVTSCETVNTTQESTLELRRSESLSMCKQVEKCDYNEIEFNNSQLDSIKSKKDLEKTCKICKHNAENNCDILVPENMHNNSKNIEFEQKKNNCKTNALRNKYSNVSESENLTVSQIGSSDSEFCTCEESEETIEQIAKNAVHLKNNKTVDKVTVKRSHSADEPFCSHPAKKARLIRNYDCEPTTHNTSNSKPNPRKMKSLEDNRAPINVKPRVNQNDSAMKCPKNTSNSGDGDDDGAVNILQMAVENLNKNLENERRAQRLRRQQQAAAKKKAQKNK